MKTKQTLQKQFKKALFTLLFVLPLGIMAQQNISEWSFKTNGNIMNSPTVSNGSVYIGSYDSIFYAIDSLGTKIWDFDTDYPVQSGSVVHNTIVSFQSGNRLYGLNKNNGTQVWKHEPDEVKNNTPTVMLNVIDFKDATPIVKDSIVYYGNEYGKFYGVNLSTGTETFMFDTENGYPITSTGIFSNDTVYFADMEGYVYAVNITTNTKLWQMRIYDGNKPYYESGPVIGNLVIDEDLLYFGLQHGVLSVVNRFTGDVAWTVGDTYGTWYSGTPIINNGIMHIGTSDTKQLAAFDAKNGEHLWSVNCERGMYNQPIIYNNTIIILGGYDTYEKVSDENGSGRLLILDLAGNIKNKISLSGSVFGNPILHANKLYFGSMDDHLYCFDIDKITDSAKEEIEFDNASLELEVIDTEGSKRVSLPTIYNNGSKYDELDFTWYSDNLPEESITHLPNRPINAQDSILPYIFIKSRLLENRDYSLTFKIQSANNADLLIEKTISFSRNIVGIKDSKKDQGSLNVYPNPMKNTINFELPETFTQGTLTLFDNNGKLLISQPIDSKEKITVNVSDIGNQRMLFYYLSDEHSYYSGKLIKE